VDGVEHRDQDYAERDDPLAKGERVPGRDVERNEDEGRDDEAERRRACDREDEERRNPDDRRALRPRHAPPFQLGRAVADRLHPGCHYAPSGVRSPSSPSGRKTRIRIRIAKMIDWLQSLPGACQPRPLLNDSTNPITSPPSTAPGRLPIPPRTAAVKAIRPTRKPSV